MSKEPRPLSAKIRITLIAITCVFSISLILFCLTCIISVVGYRGIFDEIEKYQAVESTHTVEISSDNGYTTLKNLDNNEPLKLLQLSDLHICCSVATFYKDKSAFDAIYALIQNNKPDLIIVTGDMNYPLLFTLCTNNSLQAEAIGTFFEKVEIPWTFVFGNHDGFGFLTNATNETLADYYTTLPHCLFSQGPENIYGVGNYAIKTLNNDGSLNKVLMFMDSNSYIKGVSDYDKIHDDQIEWYKSTLNSIADDEGKATNEIYSLLFIHIPLTEYKTAYNLYSSGSDEVELIFGSKNENSATPDVKENFFDDIVSLGSTKAIFAGHDHLNNFCIKYKDVLLTYGMSIDYTAYVGIHNKTSQRGGTIIYLTENSDIVMAQAPQSNGFKELETGYNKA